MRADRDVVEATDTRVRLTFELVDAVSARAAPYLPALDALADAAGTRCAQLFAPGVSAGARPPMPPVPSQLRDDPAVHQLAIGCVADARLSGEQREFALLRPELDAYFLAEGEAVTLPSRRDSDRVWVMPNGMYKIEIRRPVRGGRFEVEVRLVLSR